MSEVIDVVSPKSDNPYLHARTEWAERYGDYVASARNWRYIGLGAIAVSILLGLDNWHLANKAESVPYIVKQDDLGQVLYVGAATRNDSTSPLIIRAALSAWIHNTRSISSDQKVLRFWVDNAYAFVARASLAYATLTTWYSDRQPFVMAEKVRVSVQIESALPVGTSASTWRISWRETTTQGDGSQATERWEATITFEQQVPKADTADAVLNPIGLRVTEFAWQRNS
jgi:type IV secretory pathway TrbF-like protein